MFTIPINKIKETNLFEENYNAALSHNRGRPGNTCMKHALKGSAGEIGAMLMLGRYHEVFKNEHLDMRMVYSYDLYDAYYRYEVKTVSSGEYPTFHTNRGRFSDNGDAGFDLTSALTNRRSDWILIMGVQTHGDSMIIKPEMMVWTPSLEAYAIKSRTKGRGYYFDIMKSSVEDEYLVGTQAVLNFLSFTSSQG